MDLKVFLHMQVYTIATVGTAQWREACDFISTCRANYRGSDSSEVSSMVSPPAVVFACVHLWGQHTKVTYGMFLFFVLFHSKIVCRNWVALSAIDLHLSINEIFSATDEMRLWTEAQQLSLLLFFCRKRFEIFDDWFVKSILKDPHTIVYQVIFSNASLGKRIM